MKRPVNLAAVRSALERLDALGRCPELTTNEARTRCAGWLDQEATMAPTKAPTKPTTHQTAFRLPGDLLERLDAFATRLRADHPGMAVSRADVVRLLLTRGLDEASSHTSV